MSQDQRDVRRDYAQSELRRDNIAQDPMQQFGMWLEDAHRAELVDATSMTLATVAANGQPSARIVLLKHFDAQGYAWYTGYGGQKAIELAANNKATLLFYWRELERQVRISGVVEQVPLEYSESYFASRPEDSRFSAAASEQSQVIADRPALEAKVAELRVRYPDGDVPMPKEWGGYRLQPSEYEFWQGRVGRLHDRFRYQPTANGWQIDRLQP